MKDKIKDRINNIMSAVFEVPVEEIYEDFSHDNVRSWDSMKHMNLVVAMEEEFNVQFLDEEIVEMVNYSLIKHIIFEKLDLKSKLPDDIGDR